MSDAIQRLRELREAATPGPWRSGRHLTRTLYRDANDGVLIGMLDQGVDTAYVVALVNAHEAMAAVVEAARVLVQCWPRCAECGVLATNRGDDDDSHWCNDHGDDQTVDLPEHADLLASALAVLDEVEL